MQISPAQTNNLSALSLQPVPVKNGNSSAASPDARSDQADLSLIGKALNRSGLDASASSFMRQASSFSYNLSFNSSELLSLSANGIYAEKSQTLDLSMSFVFEREILKDGQWIMQRYQADLSISISQFESASLNRFEKKEDIMDLARRLIDDIWKVQGDPDKKLAGFILDNEDFLELATVEDGKLLKELIALVQAIHMSALLVEQLEGKDNREDILLHPKRIKSTEVEAQAMAHEVVDFAMEVKELNIVNQLLENESAPTGSDESGIDLMI